MRQQSQATSVASQRQVRVFVSSTFRDMQEERDELVLHTFPEIRRRCRERKVDFVEVDLRWGITEEQSERGEVLPICLAEIDNCRPYFIGLLGERYGWVPEHIDQELVDDQPWLAEHLEKSVTEMEILHGVLNSPEMAGRSYFYFRDPGYSEARGPGFVSEKAESKEKLEKLKNRIRASGLRCEESYPDPVTLGKLILEDLWAAIDKEFPEVDIPDPLDQEAFEHEAFAQSRAKVYIGRDEYFKRLDEHVNSDGPPLILTGESGVGKSALLSNWAIRYREAHPDDFVILHFIGSSPQSAGYVAIMRRIMAEIKRRYDPPEEIPETPEKLREALPLWLASASAKGRLILILEGLNQLEDRDNAPHLGWLPEYIPPNVRLIVSSLAGPTLDALMKREWPQFEVKGLQREERKAVTLDYLASHRKTLSEAHLERIVNAEQTANPLYLKALLDELRVFGIHEKLGERIEHYLAANTVPDLYEKVLESLEEAFERDRPELVGDAMSFIWASRRGLYESELLELLSDSDEPLPRAIWSPLHLAMEASLISRSGLLSFFHDYLRQAVERRYLPRPDAHRARHIRLADYFEGRDADDRKADEVPWQLHAAQEWKRLKDCVKNCEIFKLLATESNRYELHAYWVMLNPHYDMVDAYRIALTDWNNIHNSGKEMIELLNSLGFLYYMNYRYNEALEMFKEAIQKGKDLQGDDDPQVMNSWFHLGIILEHTGKLDEALENLSELLAAQERVYGPDHPDVAKTLNALGTCHFHKGQADIELAGTYHLRALRIRIKSLGPIHSDVAQSHHNMGVVFSSLGNSDAARILFEHALAILERTLGPWHYNVAWVLQSLGDLAEEAGNCEQAHSLWTKALGILEKAMGPRSVDSLEVLFRMALSLFRRGDLLRSEEVVCDALAICQRLRKTGGRWHRERDLTKIREVIEYYACATPEVRTRAIERTLDELGIEQKSEESLRDLRGEVRIHVREQPSNMGIPTPHSAADPKRASEANVKYQNSLRKWQALPWWKRLFTRRPDPPRGI